jgi:hypothetical protein
MSLLKRDVYETAAEKNPTEAWNVVSTLICGRRTGATRFVEQHMAEKIQSHYESGGEGGSEGSSRDEYVERSTTLLSEGRAMAPVVVQLKAHDLLVSYETGDHCTRDLKIRFNGRSWLLVGISDGCPS